MAASSRRTVFALLTALACLIGQVGAMAHLGLVRHVRCLEHDALVHTGSSGTDAHAAADAPRGHSAQGVPADVETHGDDHCLVAGLRRRDAELPPPEANGLVAAPAEAPAPLPEARADIPPAPVDLLTIAPKSSPPGSLGLVRFARA